MITIGTHPANMTDKEIRAYIGYMSKQHPDITAGTLDIVLTKDGEDVELAAHARPCEVSAYQAHNGLSCRHTRPLQQCQAKRSRGQGETWNGRKCQ